MSKISKIEIQILSGRSDANIDFTDLCRLLNKLGFDERIKGSHHIFTKGDVEEIINIQPVGSKAKAYQVKQVRNLILKYKLGASDE
ncbi:MAG TPA: type II toxin-antitoxin system HicA family toxin [Pyrinomonadaceae bacterium]|nr:type II toxin-antitoxin system HicA family toxin [Pyrinomonadaceae bacterium]